MLRAYQMIPQGHYHKLLCVAKFSYIRPDRQFSVPTDCELDCTVPKLQVIIEISSPMNQEGKYVYDEAYEYMRMVAEMGFLNLISYNETCAYVSTKFCDIMKKLKFRSMKAEIHEINGHVNIIYFAKTYKEVLDLLFKINNKQIDEELNGPPKNRIQGIRHMNSRMRRALKLDDVAASPIDNKKIIPSKESSSRGVLT